MRAVVVTVLFALVPSALDRQVGAQEEAARALVRRAQQALGGVIPLANIKSLEWSRLDGSHYRIRFPDRYRIDRGNSIVIFDGERLNVWRPVWQPDAAEWTESPAPNQRTVGLRRVAESAVMFLLRTSPVYRSVSIDGSRALGPLKGTVLVFQSAQSGTPPMRVVVDDETARIRGVVAESIIDSRYQVQVPSEYRNIGGISIPHAVHVSFWTEEWTPLPGGRPTTLRFTDVRINSVSAADVDIARAKGPK